MTFKSHLPRLSSIKCRLGTPPPDKRPSRVGSGDMVVEKEVDWVGFFDPEYE